MRSAPCPGFSKGMVKPTRTAIRIAESNILPRNPELYIPGIGNGNFHLVVKPECKQVGASDVK